MSTNFYLHHPSEPESIHLGKRYAAGGNATGWVTGWVTPVDRWKSAQDLIEFIQSIHWGGAPMAWIADEYARIYSADEFVEVIRSAEFLDCTRGEFR